MSENGEGGAPRKVVARDPLAELGEIELAGVLRRVRPGPRPDGEQRAQSPNAPRSVEPPRGGVQSLSGRPPLPGASISGRTGAGAPSGPPRVGEGGSAVLDRRLRKPVLHEPSARESGVREPGPAGGLVSREVPAGPFAAAPHAWPAGDRSGSPTRGASGDAGATLDVGGVGARGDSDVRPRRTEGPLFELLEEIPGTADADSEGARPVETGESAAGEVAVGGSGRAAGSGLDSRTAGAREARGPSEDGEGSAPRDPDGTFIDGRSSVRFFVRGQGSRETAADPAEIERRYEEGKRHAAAGQYAKAIQAYHDVLRHDPRHVRARNNLGFAYDCRGDFDLAINEYMAALELDPKNVQIQCNLGAVYGAKGRYDLAEEALRQAIRTDPKSAEAHCNLGIVYCKKGMYHLATAELKRALELQPDHVHAHYYLGECYNHLDRHEEAIQAFEKALEGQPQNHKAYYNLGILYDKKNMPDRAMLMYRRAREVHAGSGARPAGS